MEYVGTRYNGFQYQPEVPTIQRELERVITKITGEAIRVRGASRTDSGVHAQGQVVDFCPRVHYPQETWIRAFNYYLPWDIKVKEAHQVPLDFQARRDALGRIYRYTILNSRISSPLMYNQCAWLREPLDWETMAEASRCLVGVHDFSPLAGPLPANAKGVRHVKRWDVWREGDLVLIEAEANAFLPHQILRTNAILVEIGRGEASVSLIKDVIKGSTIQNRRTPTLPAKGLCLLRVEYLNFPPS